MWASNSTCLLRRTCRQCSAKVSGRTKIPVQEEEQDQDEEEETKSKQSTNGGGDFALAAVGGTEIPAGTSSRCPTESPWPTAGHGHGTEVRPHHRPLPP